MPAKKTASKQRKKTPASRSKASAKKAAARKKVTKKRTATKKKAAPARKKKAASKKKVTKKKKVAKKKAGKKKVAKKKVARKKKVAKKKVAKKTAARKKVSKKKVSKKKPVSKKKGIRKKVATKKVSRKKATAAKKVSRKRPIAKKSPARKKRVVKKPAVARSRGSMLSGPIHGIDPYKPSRGEEYMSPEQLEHFRDILSSWKKELMFEVDRTVHHMQDEAANFPDPNDRATQESEFGLELRTRDRERKLLRKIDQALGRIDDGSYGFCDETGEEIGLKRLEARPVATLCLEAQERREMAERQFRDRDDRYR